MAQQLVIITVAGINRRACIDKFKYKIRNRIFMTNMWDVAMVTLVHFIRTIVDITTKNTFRLLTAICIYKFKVTSPCIRYTASQQLVVMSVVLLYLYIHIL